MKKIFLSLLFCIGVFAYSQNTSQPNTIVLVNGALASSSFISANQKNIKSTRVFKNTLELPAQLKNLGLGDKKSVIAVDVKENYYDKISLAELNEQFGLPKNNPVYFDGNLLNNTEVKILGDALQEMKVGETEGKKVLNIWSKKQQMPQI
jgi:hypothetical protein